MKEEEIKAIETHIKIHAKAEPRAIKITKILRKAVRELKENNELRNVMKYQDIKIAELERQLSELRNTFLVPKPKPFDAPQHSIELKLPGEIPNPFK